jgi:hypothetical protein
LPRRAHTAGASAADGATMMAEKADDDEGKPDDDARQIRS